MLGPVLTVVAIATPQHGKVVIQAGAELNVDGTFVSRTDQSVTLTVESTGGGREVRGRPDAQALAGIIHECDMQCRGPRSTEPRA